mmetsp:Transcript_47076/g.102430  ORF Transcript_47076/g.102430 Transcript_47076/m.102430 type:complete len:214 (+) Transcript_47076:51-692(+)
MADTDIAQAKRIVTAVLALVFFSLVAMNGWFIYKWHNADAVFSSLTNGKCELTSLKYTPVLPKQMWDFPFGGETWTDVPCNVQLKISKDDVPETRLLRYTYHQGLLPNVLTDTCKNLVTQTPLNEPFDCCYQVDADGKVMKAQSIGFSMISFLGSGGTYKGKKEELPNLPLLLLMRAVGLFLATMLPLGFVAVCCVRNSVRRAEGREYMPLEA